MYIIHLNISKQDNRGTPKHQYSIKIEASVCVQLWKGPAFLSKASLQCTS